MEGAVHSVDKPLRAFHQILLFLAAESNNRRVHVGRWRGVYFKLRIQTKFPRNAEQLGHLVHRLGEVPR